VHHQGLFYIGEVLQGGTPWLVTGGLAAQKLAPTTYHINQTPTSSDDKTRSQAFHSRISGRYWAQGGLGAGREATKTDFGRSEVGGHRVKVEIRSLETEKQKLNSTNEPLCVSMGFTSTCAGYGDMICG